MEWLFRMEKLVGVVDGISGLKSGIFFESVVRFEREVRFFGLFLVYRVWGGRICLSFVSFYYKV